MLKDVGVVNSLALYHMTAALFSSSFFHVQWRKIRAKGINLTRTPGNRYNREDGAVS